MLSGSLLSCSVYVCYGWNSVYVVYKFANVETQNIQDYD